MAFELTKMKSRSSTETKSALQHRGEVAESVELADETDAEIVRAVAEKRDSRPPALPSR